MRTTEISAIAALSRAVARLAPVTGLVLMLTFVAHHGIAAASDHPLDVLGTHGHSDHHDAPHDHDPHTDAVSHPKRTMRWTVVDYAPDIAPPSIVVAAAPVFDRLSPFARPRADDPPARSGTDWRVLFQTFLI